MKELHTLFFCHNCYATTSPLLISSCMHITCTTCTCTPCTVCHADTEHVQLTDARQRELAVVPGQLMDRPMRILSFQLESAINKIAWLDEERRRYRGLLVRARNELMRVKGYRHIFSDGRNGKSRNDKNDNNCDKHDKYKYDKHIDMNKYKYKYDNRNDKCNMNSINNRNDKYDKYSNIGKYDSGHTVNVPDSTFIDTIKFTKRMMNISKGDGHTNTRNDAHNGTDNASSARNDGNTASAKNAYMKRLCISNYSTDVESECTASNRLTIPVKRSRRFFYKKKK